MHTTSAHLLTAAFGPALKRATTLPPTFLVPYLIVQCSSFSTTPSQSARKDGNPRRGVSALHRKGPKRIDTLTELLSRIPGADIPSEVEHLSPAKKRAALNDAIARNLPKPVLDPAKRTKVETDPDHGLWDFFNEERTALSTPVELNNHGRAWTVAELRNKDWEDLWRLWWVCAKERNRLESFKREKSRVGGDMYGDYEVEQRGEAVETTMKAIKHALTERWYSWENARQVAMEDGEVDLYADAQKGEPAYLPKEVEMEAELAEGETGYPPLPEAPTGRPEARP